MKRLILLLAAASVCGMLSAQLDRSRPPAPGPAPAVAIGKSVVEKLENGLTVIVVEDHSLPRVSWNLSLDVKPVPEGPKAGAARFAGDLMRSGSRTRAKADLDEAIDFIGAQLSTSSTGAYVSSLTKHSETALSLLAEVVLTPVFPEQEIEKLRAQTLSGLKAITTNPGGISSNLRNRLVFGAQHAYGEVETEATIKAITRDDLRMYHTGTFRPSIAYLVVVGDITPKDAVARARAAFGAWESETIMNLPFPLAGLLSGNRVCFADVPGAVQSTLYLTHGIDLTPGHPDAIACSVMNTMLGGGAFGSRLMQNLREDKAFTYGARSSVDPDPIRGTFEAFANVRNEVTDSAVVEFLAEIRRIRDTPPPAEELDAILRYMNGSFARSLEQPETIARFALNIERYGLPADYYTTYLKKLAAITPAEVQRVAQNYLKPDNLFITCVGNREAVAESLTRFDADGVIEFFDAFAAPVRDVQPAPAGITVQGVVERHYSACGGAAAFKALKSLRWTGKAVFGPNAQGSYTRECVFGTGHHILLASGETVLLDQVVTPTFGTQTRKGAGSKDMEEIEMIPFREALAADRLAQVAARATDARVVGIGRFEGADVHVIEWNEPAGVSRILEFDVASGRLVRETRVLPGEGNRVVTVYRNYTKFGPVTIATEEETTQSGRTITLQFDKVEPNADINTQVFTAK